MLWSNMSKAFHKSINTNGNQLSNDVIYIFNLIEAKVIDLLCSMLYWLSLKSFLQESFLTL